MKEKLQEYALIAEIISAICIVLSLIFVGLQINQNTQQNRLNAAIEIKQETAARSRDTLQNPKLVETFVKVTSGEQLTAEESMYFSLFANDIFDVGDIAFEHFKNGMLDEDDLLPTMNAFRFWMGFENVQTQWERVKDTNYQNEYVEFVEGFLESD